jgi:predicted kinase
MTELIITVGIPRSGKTTWARDQKLPIVNPDAIRLAIHGRDFIADAEPFVWATAYTMARSLFIAGCSSVIIDATNTTPKRRKDWVYKFPDTQIVFKVFDTSVATCVERAVLDQREDLIPVIERMAANWDISGLVPDTYNRDFYRFQPEPDPVKSSEGSPI